MKCLTALLGVAGIVTSCTLTTNAQTSTIQPGQWSSPSVWSNGIVPDRTSGEIIINHRITIPEDTAFTVDDITVNDTLIIAKRAAVTLSNTKGLLADLRITSGCLKILGRLICRDSATFSGTTAVNTIFYDSASYEHRYVTTAGSPPTAQWYPHANLEITGYITGKSLSSPGWDQLYGNVLYNCTQQQNGSFVELLGNIRRVQGNFVVKTTNSGVLRVTLDKTALTTIAIGGDLVIEGNSEVWLSRNGNTAVNVGGDFQFRSTSTASSYLTTTGTCQLIVAGNMIVDATAPFRFASSGGGTGTLRVRKDFSFDRGTMTLLPVGYGTLILDGTLPQHFSAQGNMTTGVNVEMNNPQGVVIDAVSAIGGNVLIRSSSLLKITASDLILQGNLDIENGGSIQAGHSTLHFSGGATQSLSLQGDTLYNVHINKPSATTVTLTSTALLKNQLWIQAPGVTVSANGNLTLLSSSDDGGGDAYVRALPAGSTITGPVTVQRFMQGEGKIYRYISSPVSNATVADLQDDFPVTGTFNDASTGPGIRPGDPSLYYYDESLPGSDGWTKYPPGGWANQHPLLAGKGYSAFIRQGTLPTTWDVTGTLNQHEVDLQVTYTNTGDLLDGWNLVGNPYPSSIDWDAETGWTKIHIEDEIAVRDNGSGTFLYWDGSIGSLGSGRIAKGQSFWVQTNGNNPLLIIDEPAKSISNAPFYRSRADDVDYVEIVVDHHDLSDKAYLRLRHDALAGYDRHDIHKWDNDRLNLALTADTLSLAIAATDRLDCSVRLPLRLYFGNGSLPPAGDYTLHTNSFGVFQHATILLHDQFTQQAIDLSKGAYHFSVSKDPGSVSKNRFSLQIIADTLAGRETVTADSLLCHTSGPFVVDVVHLQRETRYEVWLNSTLSASYLNTDPDHHTFLLEPGEGKNNVQIIARNACATAIVKDISVRKVGQLENVVISEVNDTLWSSFLYGNQWYFNGKKLDNETSFFIRPETSGEYSTEVNLSGCFTSASYAYIFQDDHLQFFPDPCTDHITLVAAHADEIDHVKIFNSKGQLVKRSTFAQPYKQTIIPVTDLSPGIYVAEIISSRKRSTVRFVKE